ncbi:hypothetical protein CHGG_05885 [Chaetomium globosum CBS 148.51]|uniref:C2H2-type domain-containing protein n=1 Tax=Chaetomium globosum (strain ATCC 6205 / CBS 148.51 / DSM 1962 / NBRC 6347 / NRRL 1970) TaxID=306901 RepID=Q2H630_CHAGB|nr:uncharacterized protein CHGG_05885 [Chaetomium globosum CBS 148.51]EAQ89266.1 hypothetical protein CHGG_05885 [Chaetomium globosum CBS 148.51]
MPSLIRTFKGGSAMVHAAGHCDLRRPQLYVHNQGFPSTPRSFPGQPTQGGAPSFSTIEKPVLASNLPEVDGSMFWPGFNAGASDLPSTVSSIALSSTMDESPSERLSQNTSQSTLFNPSLGPYQSAVGTSQDHDNISASQQYMFPPQMSFNAGLTSLPGHVPPSSAMSIDEPLSLPQSPISPADLRSATSSNNSWWRPKVEVETPQPNPPSAGPGPCFPLQPNMLGDMGRGVSSGLSSPTSPTTAASPYYQVQSASTHAMSRALSQESMQSSMTTVFGTPIAEGGGHGALTPRAENHQHAHTQQHEPQHDQQHTQQHNHQHNHPHNHQHTHQHGQHSAATQGKPGPESSVEDLVCDECQWKPRGVRENLKGYLRKHKNTHRGVRLACDVPGCVKTFSRLDNLKKHKKDKHGIEDTGGSVPAKRVAGDISETIEEEAESKRPTTVESEIRAVTEDYSMLWPALHF